MNTRRFNYDRGPGAPSRLSPRKYSKWIGVSHISGPLLRNSGGAGRKRIFAIVAPAEVGHKIVRRILIFDNHPASLRLVSARRLDLEVNPIAPPHTSHLHVALGSILILVLVLAMFWPLIGS